MKAAAGSTACCQLERFQVKSLFVFAEAILQHKSKGPTRREEIPLGFEVTDIARETLQVYVTMVSSRVERASPQEFEVKNTGWVISQVYMKSASHRTESHMCGATDIAKTTIPVYI